MDRYKATGKGTAAELISQRSYATLAARRDHVLTINGTSPRISISREDTVSMEDTVIGYVVLIEDRSLALKTSFGLNVG